MSRVLDPEGAHLAALRRLGAFRDQRILELGCGDAGSRSGSPPTRREYSPSTPTRKRSTQTCSTRALGNASRHGRVEHRRPLGLHPLREFTARPRAHRAHVDPDLPVGEAGEDPVGPRRDAFEHLVVGNRRNQDVGGFRNVARGVAPLQPLVHELVCVAAVARLAIDGVSGVEEPGGHVSAHVPQADEADSSWS